MVLLNSDDAIPAGIKDAVSKSEIALWRQRLWGLHRGLHCLLVQALVPANRSLLSVVTPD